MGIGYFYATVIVLSLTVIGLIGDGIAILTGYVHPWDFK